MNPIKLASIEAFGSAGAVVASDVEALAMVPSRK